jgi:hypothetical protein
VEYGQKARNSCILDLSGSSNLEREILQMSRDSKFPKPWVTSYKTLKANIVKTTQAVINSVNERNSTSFSARSTSPSDDNLNYIREILDNLKQRKQKAFIKTTDVKVKCPGTNDARLSCPVEIKFKPHQQNADLLNINFSIRCASPENNILINLVVDEGNYNHTWDLSINPTNPIDQLFNTYAKDTNLFQLLLQFLLQRVAEILRGIDTLCFIISNRYIALLGPVVDYSNLIFFFRNSRCRKRVKLP